MKDPRWQCVRMRPDEASRVELHTKPCCKPKQALLLFEVTVSAGKLFLKPVIMLAANTLGWGRLTWHWPGMFDSDLCWCYRHIFILTRSKQSTSASQSAPTVFLSVSVYLLISDFPAWFSLVCLPSAMCTHIMVFILIILLPHLRNIFGRV